MYDRLILTNTIYNAEAKIKKIITINILSLAG